VAENTQQGVSVNAESQDSESGRREQLALDSNGAEPSLRFNCRTRHGELLIELGQEIPVLLRQTSHAADSLAGDTTLEFRQPATGPLTLTWRERGAEHTVVGATLWHLLLAEPALCRRELVPILEALRSDWNLNGQCQAIENSLVRWSQDRRGVVRTRMQELVAALASPRFAERRAAERNLASMGGSALMYLSTLNFSDLDPEQRLRVQTLLGLLDHDEDKPDRAVTWLASDPRVWLALCERDDEAIRRAGAAELRGLLGEPFAFDPAATLDQRQVQLDRLRARLAPLPVPAAAEAAEAP
jgi:hypothetical protein